MNFFQQDMARAQISPCKMCSLNWDKDLVQRNVKNIDRRISCGRSKIPILVSLVNLVFHMNTKLSFVMHWGCIKELWPTEKMITLLIFPSPNYYSIENLISFCFSDSCIAKHNDGDKKKSKRTWKSTFIINIFTCINWSSYIHYIYIRRLEENLISSNRTITAHSLTSEPHILEPCFTIVVLMIISMYIVLFSYIFTE